MTKDNRSRDIFYGVVAIATLIVAIIGATLAYFSISAGSEQGAVNAKAKTVRINYNDDYQVTAQAEKLIPSSLQVMQYYYEIGLASGAFSESGTHSKNNCYDINEQEVCSVYRFSVQSENGDQDIIAMLNTENNGFDYLAYAVRDASCTPTLQIHVSEGEADVSFETFKSPQNQNYDKYTSCWLTIMYGEDEEHNPIALKQKSIDKCSNTGEDEASACYTVSEGKITYSTLSPQAVNSIFGYSQSNAINSETIVNNTEKKYDLVLFISENGKDQNHDQGKEFSGNIVVSIPGNNEDVITGKAEKDD